MLFFTKRRRRALFNLISGGFAAAGNWLLSHETLGAHATVTSGISATYAWAMYSQIVEMRKGYTNRAQVFGRTLCVSDKRIIEQLVPALYFAITLLLLATYGLTALYEGNADPNTTETKSIHTSLAVLSIVIPCLLNTYIMHKYPMQLLPEIDDLSDENLARVNDNSIQWHRLRNSFKKIVTDRDISSDLMNFFNETGFHEVGSVERTRASDEYTFSLKFKSYNQVSAL